MPPGGLHAITQLDGVMHGVYMDVQAAVGRRRCHLPVRRSVTLPEGRAVARATVKMGREKGAAVPGRKRITRQISRARSQPALAIPRTSKTS